MLRGDHVVPYCGSPRMPSCSRTHSAAPRAASSELDAHLDRWDLDQRRDWYRWVTIERRIAGGELQTVTGAAAGGAPWLAKARRTLATAAGAVGTDPDSAFTLAYDAARFACVALLVQQGLRSTTRGGHYAVEVAIRGQSGDAFDRFGSLRRQRDDIECAVTAGAPLTASDAHAAITLATEFADAAEQLLPHLGMFSGIGG